MRYRKGDVIAVPYLYSDLSGGKVRPAVVISVDTYNEARPDVIAAGLSTRVDTAGPYDHVLADWAEAGLRYPSVIRGRLLTIEQSLIQRRVGHLSPADLTAFDDRLLSILADENILANHLIACVDLAAVSPSLLQALAEKVIAAAVRLAGQGAAEVDVDALRSLLRRAG